MEKEIEFAKSLIKGRIAEVVFERMIREEGHFTVIPFGYEHTMPTLIKYRDIPKVQGIIDNIAEAPDFVLIEHEENDIHLVEVKYRKKIYIDEIQSYAEQLVKRWSHAWLFVATPYNFFCFSCKEFLEDGEIPQLAEGWVSYDRQSLYLELLNEFEQ